MERLKSDNVLLGAGVAVIAIVAFRYWNASVEEERMRATHKSLSKTVAEKKEIRRRVKESRGKPIDIDRGISQAETVSHSLGAVKDSFVQASQLHEREEKLGDLAVKTERMKDTAGDFYKSMKAVNDENAKKKCSDDTGRNHSGGKQRMMEWLKGVNDNVLLGAGVAVIAIVVLRYWNASVEAEHMRALAAARERQAKAKAEKKEIRRRFFTLEELKEFNGENGKPIYIAVLDEVYDVSNKRDFYGPGAGYHLFAGREASRALAKMSFEKEDLENEDLSDLSFMDNETLQDWVMKFSLYNGYPNVGRILRNRDLTREELRQYNGVDNPRKTCYVGVNGKIFDVTLDGLNHYGPKGGYSQFAGRDASRALACMLLTDDALDNPSIEGITEQQQKTLADWETKLAQKYPVIGQILD
ncbi:hypothetical protein Poli38472_014438 [Pythium oligandrum]|uniref:Cytochrome b5 heme-binding domain-containing protein n=1 Tax=Pythium oligandrum TaxID=41045 RepID=A0A8K1C7F2_PYTOL|nr:hypothetical protein Poli38472_014438 [Pythium oligandrum]|eukprot:TMW57835.1 hypothetical protein Poli38472_014438 [Pythium oligandrum]